MPANILFRCPQCHVELLYRGPGDGVLVVYMNVATCRPLWMRQLFETGIEWLANAGVGWMKVSVEPGCAALECS